MSDVLKARLGDVAASLQRAASDLAIIAAGLSDATRVDLPAEPVWVVAIPFYWIGNRDRREVTRRIFRHYQQVADQLGVRVTGIGSEGDTSRRFWCEYFDPVDYREYPQTFTATNAGAAGLRAKFDETVRATRHLNPERVFIGGSDDLIPVDWFAKAFGSTADLVGISGAPVIVEMIRGTANRCHVWGDGYSHRPDVEFRGGGLVFGRRLLDAWDWAPFRKPGDEVQIELDARAEGWVCEGVPSSFYAVKVGGSSGGGGSGLRGRPVLNSYQVAARLGATEGDIQQLVAFRDLWAALT